MARTPSTMLPLGTKAPDFSLVNVDGRTVSLADFGSAPALLVIFMCNHCPFVKHLAAALAKFAHEYMQKGGRRRHQLERRIQLSQPTRRSKWCTRRKTKVIRFRTCTTKRRQVAKAYRAACTPDFFLFDRDRRLVYRGQFDSSRPDNGVPITGSDLRAALDAVLAGKKPSDKQMPSIGCNIKWKTGNEPDYFG